MIELRGRRIATAFALASLVLTSTAALAAPMVQGDGPTINGVETTALTETTMSSNDTQSNIDLSQATMRPGAVNETSSTSW